MSEFSFEEECRDRENLPEPAQPQIQRAAELLHKINDCSDDPKAQALRLYEPDKEAAEKAYEVWSSRCEDSSTSAQENFAEAFKTFEAERKHSAIDVQAVASPEQEAGLIDTDQAERMLKVLGITRVIACAYGPTNHYTPRRRQDGRYLWDSMPTVVDWAAVERDLQRPGDWSLGFISCPGGTRTLDKPGRPAEIFECSLLVYEVDSIAKADQWKLWEQAGLPEPTLVMNSGGKSLHVWYRLAAPVSVEQGRIARERLAAAITAVLPGEAKADTSMVSPHQPARLAGGIHPKTGERSTIVLETGSVFELDALMALCPELPEKTATERTGTIWRDDEEMDPDSIDLPELPLAKPVPLPLALGDSTAELIANGMEPGQGGRRVVANRLSKTLQAAEAQLEELGQPFEGSALELWQQFLERSNSDGDLDDVDQVYDAHWEQNHIGEGDLSQAGLLLRLRQFAIDHCGWDPDHWIKNPAPGGWLAKARAFTQQNLEKLRELCSEGNRRNRERVSALVTTEVDVGQMMKDGLSEIQQSGLGGADLTAKLLNLAVATGQPFHSIKKAWDEFCGGVLDKEMFVSVLDEMLKGDEPMISVEELAGSQFQKLVIDDFQRQFDCDPMLVLLTVMAAMGTVLPLGTRVRGLSHTQHWRPGVLFVMILVVSGGMKSMLLEELVEKPIVGGDVGAAVRGRREALIEIQKQIEAVLRTAFDPKAGRAAAKKAWDDFVNNNREPWLKKWLQQHQNQIVIPDKMMHIVSDFTGEGIDRNAALNEHFTGYRTGFLLTTDEGRQLMGGDRYKSGSGSAGSKYTLDKLKRAWDGKGPSAVRGNKALERNYERIRLGILAFIQPEVYDEIASDETDDACGFWPRFLAYEAAPVQLRDDLSPADRRQIASNSSFRGYLSKLYGAIHKLVEVPMNDGGEVEFQFSEDAEDWWYQHQCQIGRESTREAASGDGVMGRLLGKLPAQVLDVALMLHLLKSIQPDWQSLPTSIDFGHWDKDAPAKEPAKPLGRIIPLETVKAAYTLCRQLMLRTAKQRNRAQGDGSGDRAQFLMKVQATAQKLDPEQKGIPVGQLQKGWNGAYLKKHPETKDLIYQALGALSDRKLGELTIGTSNNKGFRYRWIAPVAS